MSKQTHTPGPWPDLLEAAKAALVTMHEVVEQWSNGEDCYQEEYDALRKAIAKAEGGDA